MTANFRPAPGQIPTDPGVYRFRDGDGRVIYVGKAKNLRARLTSYFQDPAALHQRTQTMVATARALDWVVVATEVEALTLEYAWIKEFDPRFNVRYRDDKSYPFLAVTVGEEFPRAMVMRGEKRPGVRYFGPFAHAWAIRETVDQLLRVFPMRTCTRGVFRRAQAFGRPCLLGYIDKCAAPCTGEVTAEEHRAIVEDFCAFMAGGSAAFVRSRTEQMNAAAAELDYERAARLRDDLYALQRVLERNAVVLPDGTDADVVGLASDELEACVRVFHVRDGRIRGERGFIVERVDDADEAHLIATLLTQMYAEPEADVPRRVLVPALPDPSEVAVLTDWLGQQRGGPVGVSVPRRGDKRALMETVTRNASQSLAAHKLRRSGDLTTRSQALTELTEALDLPTAPLRIECFDVSNLGADDVVASMVVFEDGLPRPSEYRKFAIKGFDGQNDVAAIAEVIGRRFRRLAARGGDAPEQTPATGSSGDVEQAAAGSAPGDRPPASPTPARFAYPPSLVVIDGGAPQVNAAFQALVDLGLTNIAVVGLAKRLEEVWLPDEEDPVILPRTSQGLYLLQRVRDEAHRTAIRYQRQKRSARMTTSVLDDIPGLGPARRKALLRRFGSVRTLRAATPEMVAEVPGIGPALAERIILSLSGETISAVNLTTGEILDDDVSVTGETVDDVAVTEEILDDVSVTEEPR
ncbi:MAG TPA: excinuclease ABC subunit UvrC [Candidatus Limnocylindrales bacterium]|nr:excinuclease ABC subunit UvrC [Candidatus Limnocylindrales bacterium]